MERKGINRNERIGLLHELLNRRVVVLDGAMGTMIQREKLGEDDFRGDTFTEHPVPLKGNNDLLLLTRPDVIAAIHWEYLQAGADIIETNTFSANAISQADYGLEKRAYEINRSAARVARETVLRFQEQNPGTYRFVAGSIGPTNRSASMSPDVNRPGFRNISFDQLVDAYREQVEALVEGGVDLLLVETVFDPLNAKAALFAIGEVKEILDTDIPVMLSATVADIGGRLLTGQTLEAFLAAVSHFPLLSIGLNCAFGAEQLLPFLAELSSKAPFRISVHPNAGLPNQLGEYTQSAEYMAEVIRQMLERDLVNIVGGCCGTTPEHISRIAKLVKSAAPRRIPAFSDRLQLSGLELLEKRVDSNFINIGERTNVAGSRKFARLIREEKYAEAVSVAREQVENGAQVIDVCMDDALIDSARAMTEFLNLIAAEPDISRVPVMVDSSNFDVVLAGLKCLQGKGIVNSISLKEGEEAFASKAKAIKRFGAAVVVMLFDEQGQAVTTQRRCSVAKRSYEILVNRVGFNPWDIIFDPNILAIGTGMPEHDNQAVSFIETIRWIKENLPHSSVSGGVSNLSFSFRGNNRIREAIHSVFLYHAIEAGMDMGIVNPGLLVIYSDIPKDLLERTTDLVLNRRSDASERLLELARDVQESVSSENESHTWRDDAPVERLKYALVKGLDQYVRDDALEVVEEKGSALAVVEGPLMEAMKQVGELFGAGKMFLPQVVKSARVMKRAVTALEPFMHAEKTDSNGEATETAILLATVKGDVHDIGKNIVGVVLSCSGYRIIDLGVMVSTETIVTELQRSGAAMLGLSALITPSLDEMVGVVKELERKGLTLPVLIGGAATSELHTALRIDTEYSGPVVYVRDASRAGRAVAELLDPLKGKAAALALKKRYEVLRQNYKEHRHPSVTIEEARNNAYSWNALSYTPTAPNKEGITVVDSVPVKELVPYINWTYFFHSWGIHGRYPALLDSPDTGAEATRLFRDAEEMLSEIIRNRLLVPKAVVGLFPAVSQGDDVLVSVVNESSAKQVRIPFLRNQQKKSDSEPNLCLADFIAPHSEGVPDWIGCFVVTVGSEVAKLEREYRNLGDEYRAIMIRLIADRLAEALAEYLHRKVRIELWGYAADEHQPLSAVLRGDYRGIRPAPGYSACPDHRGKAIIFDLLNAPDALGVSLTESYAISPPESIAGFYFAHPASRYFSVGRVLPDQLRDYADRLSVSTAEAARFFPTNTDV